MFRRVRPDLCWVGLFPLNFRHLADGMLFARCRKQSRRKEHSEDGLANEATHNSLAQLSASAAMRKDESAVVGRDHSLLAVARARRIVASWDHDYEQEQEQEQE
jgi:hypothetical protein